MEIYYEVIRANITPEVLGQLKEQKIILESTSQQELKGRYSIVAFDYYGTVTLTDERLEIKTKRQNQIITTEPYNYLKTYINQFNIKVDDDLLKQLPFISGFIGTCSFDLVRHEFPILQRKKIEAKKEHNDVQLYMIEDVYVFDHYRDELYVISTNQFSEVKKEELKTRVKKRIEKLSSIKVYEQKVIAPPKRTNITANITDNDFIKNVKYLKQLIKEGDMFQVVPSRIYHYQHHFGENKYQLSYQLYQNLKRRNPSPYMYFINMGGPIIVGSSPESFCQSA